MKYLVRVRKIQADEQPVRHRLPTVERQSRRSILEQLHPFINRACLRHGGWQTAEDGTKSAIRACLLRDEDQLATMVGIA